MAEVVEQAKASKGTEQLVKMLDIDTAIPESWKQLFDNLVLSNKVALNVENKSVTLSLKNTIKDVNGADVSKITFTTDNATVGKVNSVMKIEDKRELTSSTIELFTGIPKASIYSMTNGDYNNADVIAGFFLMY